MLERRAALAQAVAEGRAAAAAAEGLVAPVAARKLRQELEQVLTGKCASGRVVVQKQLCFEQNCVMSKTGFQAAGGRPPKCILHGNR